MDVIIAAWVFFLGSAFGSFLNVLIDRPMQGKTMGGRSSCDYCGHQLSWYELIPIISYVILRGRCMNCHRKLSLQYPLVEALTGVLFVLAYPSFFFVLILFSLLGIIVSDSKYLIIPDWAVVSIFIAGLFISMDRLPLMFASSCIVTMLFLLAYVLTYGTSMGFGDVKLVFVLGFVLPLPLLLLGLYIGIMLGGIVAFYLLLAKKAGMKSAISFGPFLAIGSIISLYYQHGF